MHRTLTIAMAIAGLWLAPLAVRAADEPAGSKTESAKEAIKDTSKTVGKEVTDSWLTLKTKMALLADERVSATDVKVATEKGVVALRGKVDSQEARQAAEEVARKIDGVKDVKNELTVVSKSARKAVDRQDDQIVKDVEKRLKSDAQLKKASISVRADKGIVTLTGKAPSLTLSARASEVAHKVPGVRAVRNDVTIEKG
jgi:hyperosmotically inducible protein